MNVRLRPARSTDAPRLTAIAHAAKRHWGYPEGMIQLWSDELTISPRFIREHSVWCATLDDRIVGFYAITGADGFELDHLWVEPDHHRRGIGTTLLQHAIQRARREGATLLRIVAEPHAAPFYEKHGAGQVGSVASTPAGRRLPVMELAVDRAGSDST